MAIFQKKKSTVYLAKQTAKSVPATITGNHAIDVLMESDFIQPKGELIDRGLIRGSRWPSQQVAGGRWGEGGLVVEFRGSGTPGVQPEYGPAIENVLGTVYTNAADTVNGDGTTTTLTATSGTYHVGQMLRVAIGSGYEIGRVLEVSGQNLTFAYAFSQAPTDGAVIAPGVSYLHIGTEDPEYLTIVQYLDGLRLFCPDDACESLNISVNERKVITAKLGMRSLTCAESTETDSLTPVYDETAPLIGTECQLMFNGSALDMKSLEFNLTTRRARGGINSAGYSELPWSGQFEAQATLTPWVEDAAPITAFFDGSTVNAIMTKGDTAGNILHIELAGLQRTGPEIGEDEGDFSWSDPMTITSGVYIGLF